MNILATITESDFGRQANSSKWQSYRIRKAARAILLDENSRIALMYVASDNYYKLPGGGVDGNEGIKTALRRELLEEVGATSVEMVSEVGIVDEYREEYEVHGHHQCFIARVAGPLSNPKRTDKEAAEGYETVWTVDIDEAIRMVERGSPKHYGHNFEKLRELAFLREAKDILNT